MAYSVSEQSLYDHLRGTLPSWFFQTSASPEEIWGAYVKLFDAARAQADGWGNYARILEATGIWLDQHAVDRGTARQAGESDEELRTRIRVPEDSVTLGALLTRVQAILTASGIPSPSVAIVELRRDKAFFSEGGELPTAYMSRGYRLGGANRPLKMIVILPYGTTEATRKAVDEYLRAHKAGGFAHTIEVRAVP